MPNVLGTTRITENTSQRTINRHNFVIRLSLGKLLVNLLQVVKRTNTPTNFLTKGVVGRTMGFWVVGSIPTIHNNKLFRFSPCRT